MEKSSKILVAGNTGLLGTALERSLRQSGYDNVHGASTDIVDFTLPQRTLDYFRSLRPEYVFMCAARVGGIAGNTKQPADFIRDNLLIETNTFEAARLSGTKKVLFYGSSCMYPRVCAQPMKEDYIMTGPVEPTSAPYALAKLAGLEMVKAYKTQYGLDAIAVIPCSLYGPNDEYDPLKGHLLSALMTRFHKAKMLGHGSVTLWGTGKPIREFMYVDDAAVGSIFLMNHYNESAPINLSVGKGLTVREYAELMASVVGWDVEIVYDTQKPDGAPAKVLDSSRISSMGWKSKIDILDGLRKTYTWFCENEGNL